MRASSELKSFRIHSNSIATPNFASIWRHCFFVVFLLSRYYICWSVAVLLCAMCTYDIKWSGNKEIKSKKINFSIRRQFCCFLFFRQLSVRSTLLAYILFYYSYVNVRVWNGQTVCARASIPPHTVITISCFSHSLILCFFIYLFI